MTLEYVFSEDVVIKNVFLLFNMEMMSADAYKVIQNSRVKFRSSKDRLTGGIELVEVEHFKDDIGSGFFPTGFTVKAKYF